MSKDAGKVLTSREHVLAAKPSPDGKKRQYKLTKEIQGLYLIAHPTGSSYVHEYYVREGAKRVKRTFKLGEVTRRALELDDIKARADERNRAIAAGADPVAVQKAKRTGMTVGQLLDLRLQLGDFSDETRTAYRGYFKKDVKPKYGHLPVDDFTTDHVREIRAAIMGRNSIVKSDRTVAAISGTYSWAVDQGLAKVNPASGLKKQAASIARAVTLTDDDVRNVWRATSSSRYSEAVGLATKVALLTGLRRSEVIKARVEQLDLTDIKNAVLVLRAAKLDKGKRIKGDTKNDREHVVPLPRQAVALLKRALELAGEDAEYVFPSQGGEKYPHLTPRSASRALWKVREDFGIGEATMHDFRRTVATHLGEDEDFLTIKRVLGHASSDVTLRHYLHSPKVMAVRAALQRWADHVEKVVEGRAEEGEKVVALRA